MTTTQTTTNDKQFERQVLRSAFKADPSVSLLKRSGYTLHFPFSPVSQAILAMPDILAHLQSDSTDAVPLGKLSDGKTVVMVQWREVQKSPPKLTPQMQRTKDFKKKVRETRRAKKDEIAREARKAAQEKRRDMMAKIEEDLLATHQIEHPFEHQELIEGLQLDEAQKKKRAENRKAAKLATDGDETDGEETDGDSD